MNGSRFDAWTRRRVGGVMAGFVAGLLGLESSQGAEARRRGRDRKRKRRKRKQACEKPRTRCNPKNDKELCCPGYACAMVPELGGRRCCRLRFGSCQDDGDCCGQLICAEDGFCNTIGR